MMKLFDLKSTAVISGMVFALLIGTAMETNAQSRRDIERERQRIEQQNRQNQRQSRVYDRRNGREYNDRSNRVGSGNAAVNQGYQQGLMAGQSDRRARKYNRFNVYRNTPASRYGGDPSSYDYLYRQGYLQGYEDGYHGRNR